ncbi:UDP-N-acetylmuramoyl-tripeptide--D-alanyl-D-alanine ligase [Flavobacterium urocaniciphilum]|uniref:UDP-N-acetylmuramoyl-tripeptide--D-alanyl-D-alanine ligase n=1 Tax=Flavobacterium urocaniciphilum TaxID=1299341 RepID=A0A1H8YR97_9FLAO|nr:UDP-N-acetylmuramoyl-tripeptide--D-alanyl-D-alanine ligase [Flavobacterium urocaniciphilum]SEP54687.1 UDP-N-acetylmuramoyl-tripeptide--D-alanyl-D-alanine ligase [Flavobacterium urocaniciphilum]
MEIKEIYNYYLQSSGIATDNRKINPDNIFVALKGDNFNGNKFALSALENGAKYAIIDEAEYKLDNRFILVENSLLALQRLANYHRKQLNITIVGLTGSNGKTTTKELINAVLSQKYNTKATLGNLNNHIGVPLTLLSFDNTTEMGIVEMGANHQKEIEMLCEICEPDFGYITNFGKAHLEGFGGTEGVIKGKSELYNFLASNNKTAIVNIDDTIQNEKTQNLNRITFGLNNNDCFVNIKNIETNPMVKIEFENITIQSHLIGLYNANNINAAITIGKHFGVSNEQIKFGLENYIPNNNRSQLLEKNSNKIILDAYNANPSSMNAALTNFFQLEEQNKVAILGDMFELGNESSDEHRKLIEFCFNHEEITFYFVGHDFNNHKNSNSNMHFYESFETFKTAFSEIKKENNFILIKGSRGMSLERTLELI